MTLMTNMIHIVIGSDLFKPSIGGTETVTHNMGVNLTKAGFKVTVIAPAPKDMQTTPKVEKDPGGYTIVRVRSYGIPIQQNLRFSKHAYKQIAEYLDNPSNTPDIIHCNNPFPTSRELIKYAKKHDLPLVIGSHLMPESFTTSIRRLGGLHHLLDAMGWHYIARVYNKADRVVAPTQTALNYLLEHGLKVPTQAISNGIDLAANAPLRVDKAKLKRELGIKSQYVVVYAGRLSVEKRIDVVMAAFARLVDQYDVELILIGDGNARQTLEKQAKRLGVQDKVLFTGFVQELEQKRRYMAVSDVFAIASPVELQSIVALEAMTAGLPILAVNEGALPELAQKGVNGGTFTDGDSVGLARMIGGLLSDPELLKQYRQGSLDIIKHHDIHDTWKQYSEMYKAVIAKHNNS
ncbi:glycosyltransferase [Candidatus Saccharibacteria bacterium]|nr:glycosyltransferase [Candidatus Saccharibacteria bacterium]